MKKKNTWYNFRSDFQFLRWNCVPAYIFLIILIGTSSIKKRKNSKNSYLCPTVLPCRTAFLFKKNAEIRSFFLTAWPVFHSFVKYSYTIMIHTLLIPAFFAFINLKIHLNRLLNLNKQQRFISWISLVRFLAIRDDYS